MWTFDVHYLLRPGVELKSVFYTFICVYVQVLCEDVTKADIDAVISDLLHLYDMEAKCI